MDSPDLSKLSIDRTAARIPRARRRLWPWAVGLVLLVATAVLGFSGGLGGSVTVETASVTTAYPSQAVTVLNATGYVVAQRKAAVASKATGRLEWLGVMEGSRVKKDEIIARIESRDVAAGREQAAASVKVAEANLEQAQAELRDAERNLTRWRELSQNKLISELELDTAIARADKASAAVRSSDAAIAVARANLKVADVSFDQTLIRAPFNGVVLTKNANVGDNITPFSSAVDTKGAVLTMADMSTLEVEADVAESSLSRIKVNQPCEIQLDAVPDTRFAGMVNRIVPTIDRAKATVMVKIGFVDRDARLLPDMSAKVAFLEREVAPADRKPVTAVPRQAIVERDGAKVVFVLKDGRAIRTKIETGRALGDLVEVSGVPAGEKVVLKPLDKLADGTRIKMNKK
ncbi:efflux transporter periplasmic adaptor subunit [Candidatus Methylomirabilis limnetica]|uniref:Efflux transporter periplasmic adaptor subunit n=1 Tax=Candidatus Methylomirabilis limnetica TaxID=2033718 RepID=A0A2T4TYG5_9BACT|nr:efflux RND transporter periplasmic adaptor subunit [Candidatus Methylomirabilis limnetica]PTL36140.1 efflux transporter periplasmic adaptor subunit [Candidatus Methylomirabilis limnetica]